MKKIEPIVEKSWAQTVATPKLASILIVDDQRFDRQRLRRLCGELDFDTFVVEADSLEAMGTALDRDKFDLVILDYNLPDGTGLEAIPAIKAHSVHRRAAIIMITGEHEADIAIEAMKGGCSDYIDKNGLSLESLRRASINALQKSALSAGIETQEIMRLRVEKVLQKFTRECALEIKPMLSRMMRQMRNLSDSQGMIDPQTMSDLDTSCMRLWEFVTDLESFDGRDVVDKEFSGEISGAKREARPARRGMQADEPGPMSAKAPARPPAAAGRLFSKHVRSEPRMAKGTDLS